MRLRTPRPERPSRVFLGCLLFVLLTVSLLFTRRWGRCAPRVPHSPCSAHAQMRAALNATFPGWTTPATTRCAQHSPIWRYPLTRLFQPSLLISRRTAVWTALLREGLFSDAYPRIPLNELDSQKRAQQSQRVTREWPGGASHSIGGVLLRSLTVPRLQAPSWWP